MAASDNKNILAALEANWQAEMEGFHTYTALSKSEADPHRRNARYLITPMWLGRYVTMRPHG
jgi:hypothetical protein